MRSKGFALIEVMLAAAILSASALALSRALRESVRWAARSQQAYRETLAQQSSDWQRERQP